jgi:hypothetical protein
VGIVAALLRPGCTPLNLAGAALGQRGRAQGLDEQFARRHAFFHRVVALAHNATRIDKLAHRYRSFLYFVGALIWLR